jgi:tetratricopeptide (TPR) repeat protein
MSRRRLHRWRVQATPTLTVHRTERMNSIPLKSSRQFTRAVRFLAWFLGAGLFAANVLAQQEGDKVVVVAQKAPLRSVVDTTGTVTRGAILVVRYVNGDWFWVYWSNGYATVKGWINRSNVVPYSEALDFFSRELKRSPTAVAYNTRGKIWNERGDHDRAIEDFSEAIRLDPHVKQFYNNRGVAWDDKAHYEEAIADYDRAIELDRRYSLAFNNRGNAWSALEEYGRAIADYSEAIRLDPKDASAFFNRAQAWSVREEYEKAISDFDEAIRLDGKDALAYKNRGSAWLAKRDFDKALADFNKAIRLNPSDARAYLCRGNVWWARQDYAKAIADYDAALRLGVRGVATEGGAAMRLRKRVN